MSPDAFVALLVFLFPLACSPGPGNTFFAALGASRGPMAAIPALAGYHVATWVATVLIGRGLGGAAVDPLASRAMSVIGSLYVLWLGLSFAARARTSSGGPSEAGAGRATGFWAGAVVFALNPKAYAIIAAMFAQFLRPPVAGDAGVILIATVFTLNNLVAFVVWTLAGHAMTLLFRGGRSRRRLDALFGATLVGVASWMAWPLFSVPPQG